MQERVDGTNARTVNKDQTSLEDRPTGGMVSTVRLLPL